MTHGPIQQNRHACNELQAQVQTTWVQNRGGSINVPTGKIATVLGGCTQPSSAVEDFEAGVGYCGQQ